MNKRISKEQSEIEQEILQLEKPLAGIGHSVANAYPTRSILGYQAEWHARGIIYHTRNLFRYYSDFSREVSSRASSDAEVIVMYAPDYQNLLFELYALVNLFRISMDNLRIFLHPLFKSRSDQLPKSVKDVLKCMTDCPVYTMLSKQKILDYVIDFRNCLVHYRSFATSDNALVIEEGKETELGTEVQTFFAAMAKASFRRIGKNCISVNIFLPDRIFDISPKGEKLAKFTFDEQLNLLSMTREFARLGVYTLVTTMELLRDIDQPLYTFSSHKT